MGGVAAVLAIVFRFKNRKLSQLPTDLSASVFNKTFVVFSPYPDQKKSIHSFLVALPFVVFFLAFGLLFLGWKMLESGLILSFFIAIIGLNMILVEDAPEVFENSEIFFRAVRRETKLAPGDLRALEVIKEAARKLSNYYFGLSGLLIACALSLPYILTSAVQFFVVILDVMVKAGGWAGVVGWQVSLLLLAIGFVTVQIVASQVKNRIFKYRLK